MPPSARYARHGDVAIAWTDAGRGPLTVLFSTGVVSHVEHFWEDPTLADFFERLARFARLIVVDRRGTGLSDRITAPTSTDDEAGDLAAVLDEAGVQRAVLMGYATGAAVAVRFAARFPERTQALILYAPVLASTSVGDYDFTHDERAREEMISRRIAAWGTGALIEVVAPSRAHDAAKRAWLGRMERLSSSPGALRALLATTYDVTADVPELHVPALVLHRRGDQLIDVRHGRWVAEHLPGARYVELEGQDSLISAGDTGAILGEIEEFLTGGRGLTSERALLTVLFTDVCDSTTHARRLGDAEWRALLGAEDAAVRREVERHGGRAVKSIGDAVLAVFEGAPSRALRAAMGARAAAAGLGLELRTGLHTGECELIGDDVGGMAVHIAARVAALAQAGEILCSGTTYGTVVGADFRFAWHGEHELRGVGPWPIFALEG